MQSAESAPSGPAHSTPGDALHKLFMQPLGLTAYRLSTDLEVAPIAVSQILRGQRAISAVIALKQGTYLGVDPAFWLALQAAHDLQVLSRAALSPGPNGSTEASSGTVARCRALEGRQLVLRETRVNGKHQWEVLMVSSAAAAAKAAESPNGQKPPATKGKAKAVSGGKAAKKSPAKSGRALAGARR
jgi:addiction module HigA family antidote